MRLKREQLQQIHIFYENYNKLSDKERSDNSIVMPLILQHTSKEVQEAMLCASFRMLGKEIEAELKQEEVND